MIQALSEWAAASGLIFVQVAAGQGQINFSNVNFSTTTYTGDAGIGFYPFGSWNTNSWPYYTGPNPGSGEIFMNTQFQNPDGTVNCGTLLHEIGHAIGLKHPTQTVTDTVGSYNRATNTFTPIVHDQVLSADDPSLTIMSTVGEMGIANAHLKLLDQQAAAYLYWPAGTGGVYTTDSSGSLISWSWNAATSVLTQNALGATTTSGSNSLVSWSWDAATQTLTQTALVAIAFIHGTSVNNVIHTMSGSAAGNNQLFAFGTGTNTLYASSSGNDSLYAGPGGTNTLIGGSGNDTFYGNTGTNIEIGGSGTDTFYGGTGTNALTGGTGNDTFYVNSTATTVTAQSSGTNTNTVYSTVNFTLPANVQTLYLSGQGLTGRANNQGDSIYADPTYGGTIYGGVGTDYLCANGSGNVQIYAGNGTANLYGGSGTDLLVGGTGQNISTFTVRRPL